MLLALAEQQSALGELSKCAKCQVSSLTPEILLSLVQGNGVLDLILIVAASEAS